MHTGGSYLPPCYCMPFSVTLEIVPSFLPLSDYASQCYTGEDGLFLPLCGYGFQLYRAKGCPLFLGQHFFFVNSIQNTIIIIILITLQEVSIMVVYCSSRFHVEIYGTFCGRRYQADEGGVAD